MQHHLRNDLFKDGVYDPKKCDRDFLPRRRPISGAVGRPGRHSMKSGVPMASHIIPFAVCCCLAEDSMNILAAIKREERKLEKQLGKLQEQLEGVRAAGKALGNSAGRELSGIKKRVLSEAGRAKIAKAAKKRWAKVRAQSKKAMK